MSIYRWCQQCRAAVDSYEADIDDSGSSVCPYCGAPDEDLLSWRRMRQLNPEWPGRPDPGDHYVSKKVPARV
jgi:hypothetical protein